MERQEWLEEVEAVVSPLLGQLGLALVDVEWRRGGRRGVLRFFIDKAGGVGIADCQRVSHEAGDLLDVSGLVPEPYDLEVSSPGLDRHLRKEREFRWAAGKPIRCWISMAIDGRTEIAGRLVEVAADALTLEEPGGGTVRVPRSLITKARLELDFPPPRGALPGG